MNVPRISLISPTGALGMGFLNESLERWSSLKPDVIACDAGSTDSGPYLSGFRNAKNVTFCYFTGLATFVVGS